MTKYTIIFEAGGENYSAYCPDLPGVVAAGETKEEVLLLIKAAIVFHMQGLMEDNIPIPKPTITARSIEVAV